jgi:hypothetical protein
MCPDIYLRFLRSFSSEHSTSEWSAVQEYLRFHRRQRYTIFRTKMSRLPTSPALLKYGHWTPRRTSPLAVYHGPVAPEELIFSLRWLLVQVKICTRAQPFPVLLVLCSPSSSVIQLPPAISVFDKTRNPLYSVSEIRLHEREVETGLAAFYIRQYPTSAMS